MTRDYIGHNRYLKVRRLLSTNISCSKYVANTCSELNCGPNGECIEIPLKDGPQPTCICQDGWTGIRCEFPSCYNYCVAEGSECSVLDSHPYCKCPLGYFGVRCNQRLADYGFLQAPKHNRSMLIMLPTVLILFAIVMVAYFSVLRRHG